MRVLFALLLLLALALLIPMARAEPPLKTIIVRDQKTAAKITYRIEWVNHSLCEDGEDSWKAAITYCGKQLIVMDGTERPDVLAEDLVHEAFHAATGCSDPHRTLHDDIYVLARVTHQLFYDNPELAKYVSSHPFRIPISDVTQTTIQQKGPSCHTPKVKHESGGQ